MNLQRFLSRGLLDPLLLGLRPAKTSQQKEVINQMAAMEGQREIDTVGTGRGRERKEVPERPLRALLTVSITATNYELRNG